MEKAETSGMGTLPRETSICKEVGCFVVPPHSLLCIGGGLVLLCFVFNSSLYRVLFYFERLKHGIRYSSWLLCCGSKVGGAISQGSEFPPLPTKVALCLAPGYTGKKRLNSKVEEAV